jgi:hypothetical protein
VDAARLQTYRFKAFFFERVTPRASFYAAFVLLYRKGTSTKYHFFLQKNTLHPKGYWERRNQLTRFFFFLFFSKEVEDKPQRG